jgi:hypothetical protein
MTQILVELGWFVAFLLWTLGVYLLAKYLGQGEAYRNGFTAGHAAGYDLCEIHHEIMDEDEDEDEGAEPDPVQTFESIAGLWTWAEPEESEHRDCIRPEAK